MIPLSLAGLADVVGGTLGRARDAGRTVHEVTIDSRSAAPGALFVALPGVSHDGHEFVADAVHHGATGYLQAESHPLGDEPGAVLVDDPGDALLGLGAWVREEVDPRVVAITGSQGKTTTKDFVAAALGAARRTVANQGSYNNELGVPLTCCRLERDSEVLVAEVGARGIGHVAPLARILAPDVAVVTAVSASHLELLGDLDTVARAKAELVQSLGVEGVAVLNAEDPRVAAMASVAPGRVVTYGRGGDWRATRAALDDDARPRFRAAGPGGEVDVELPIPGAHNVGNALAALAVADACGVDLRRAAAGLREARVSRWRMELVRRDDGTAVLNDAYNANPASMAAALDTLAALRARRRHAGRALMAELGDASDDAHREIGRRCAALELDSLLVIGDARRIAEGARMAGFQGGLHVVDSSSEAAEMLAALLEPGDAVLVKASRSVGLDVLAAGIAAGTRP